MTKQDLIDFESKIALLWEAGKINAPCHLSGGNECQLIEIFKEINREDYVFTGHRNHYHALLHGCEPDSIMLDIMGDPKGRCKGRARSMGFIDRSRNFYASAIVGGMCAPAVGVAWSLKRKGSKNKVWYFVGDAVLDGGHFWEAIRYAEAWDLPIIFILENNDRATCSSLKDRFGDNHCSSMEGLMEYSEHFRYYDYEPTFPHVGTGKYVQF